MVVLIKEGLERSRPSLFELWRPIRPGSSLGERHPVHLEGRVVGIRSPDVGPDRMRPHQAVVVPDESAVEELVLVREGGCGRDLARLYARDQPLVIRGGAGVDLAEGDVDARPAGRDRGEELAATGVVNQGCRRAGPQVGPSNAAVVRGPDETGRDVQ